MKALLSVVGILAVALGAYALTMRADSAQVTVTAVFADSSPLVPGNKVQLYGVEVGTISDIRLVNGQSHVEMSLDRGVLPLHTDASVKIQPVSLLGERFIALAQGDQSAPVMGEPSLIPIEHTSSSVDLDDLLNTFDDPTSTALAATVTTLGEGLSGQGDTAAKAFAQLAPTLHQTDQLSTLLDRQNVVLNNLIVSAEKNATAFATPLDSLVAGGQLTLGAVAANRQGLDDTVTELPGTLASARRTLGQLGTTADNATGVLGGIRPLTDNLLDTSRELQDFADAAHPAFDALPDLLDRANRLLDEARPVVKALGPASSDLAGASGSVRTLSDQLLTHKPGVASQLENVLTGAANWAMATSGYDGLSHYFRAVVVPSPTTLANTGLGDLPPIGTSNPVNPVPANPNGPKVPGSKPLPYVPGLPNPDGKDNSSYTGMDRQQEHNMFDQLLGGGN